MKLLGEYAFNQFSLLLVFVFIIYVPVLAPFILLFLLYRLYKERNETPRAYETNSYLTQNIDRSP